MEHAARRLVERLGGHPATALGIDLTDEDGAGRWFVAACLLAAQRESGVALKAYLALVQCGFPSPREIAGADPLELARALAGAGYPKPEFAARKLVRASAALGERWGGNFKALAGDAEGTPDLAARIGRLAPGVGAATVALFLRPLRDVWSAAGEIPLSAAARSAAVHVGLLRRGEDEEGAPGALRAALTADPDAPELADVEAALDRLGRQACLRGRVSRCPLGDDCPARELQRE